LLHSGFCSMLHAPVRHRLWVIYHASNSHLHSDANCIEAPTSDADGAFQSVESKLVAFDQGLFVVCSDFVLLARSSAGTKLCIYCASFLLNGLEFLPVSNLLSSSICPILSGGCTPAAAYPARACFFCPGQQQAFAYCEQEYGKSTCKHLLEES